MGLPAARLEIHLIPVLLGEGRRLFEHLGADHIDLELVRVVEAPGVTHLRYRVSTSAQHSATRPHHTTRRTASSH